MMWYEPTPAGSRCSIAETNPRTDSISCCCSSAIEPLLSITNRKSTASQPTSASGSMPEPGDSVGSDELLSPPLDSASGAYVLEEPGAGPTASVSNAPRRLGSEHAGSRTAARRRRVRVRLGQVMGCFRHGLCAPGTGRFPGGGMAVVGSDAAPAPLELSRLGASVKMRAGVFREIEPMDGSRAGCLPRSKPPLAAPARGPFLWVRADCPNATFALTPLRPTDSC